MDIFLLEARQVNIEFIMVLAVTDISLHEVSCMFAVQRRMFKHIIETIHKIIKQRIM